MILLTVSVQHSRSVRLIDVRAKLRHDEEKISNCCCQQNGLLNLKFGHYLGTVQNTAPFRTHQRWLQFSRV